jgi:hypothetical protein
MASKGRFLFRKIKRKSLLKVIIKQKQKQKQKQ